MGPKGPVFRIENIKLDKEQNGRNNNRYNCCFSFFFTQKIIKQIEIRKKVNVKQKKKVF